MWFEDTKQHTFVLQELICIAPQLKEAQDSILLDSSPLNARTVQCMNGYILWPEISFTVLVKYVI